MTENRGHLKRNKIKAYIPPKIRKSEIDKFVLEGERVRCPAGKYSIGKIIQVIFSKGKISQTHFFRVLPSKT